MNKLLRGLAIGIVLLLMGVVEVPAQTGDENQRLQQQNAATEIKKDELESFIDVLKTIEASSQISQLRMIQAIEDAGMDPQRFIEISEAQQQPGLQPEVDEGEMEVFQKAKKRVEEIQNETDQQIEKKLEKEGLTPERYREIFIAIQQNPELQEKAQDLL